MLYVDELNSSAIKLYKSLGFKEWGRDVLYRLAN
jgi:predicted GNAT family acetyltransferase